MVFNSNISFSLQYAVTKNIFYTCTGTFASHFEIYIVWFQKISIPPPRRELEIPEGWGGSKAQEIPEGGGVDGRIKFQMVQFDSVPTNSCSCKKIATYRL